MCPAKLPAIGMEFLYNADYDICTTEARGNKYPIPTPTQTSNIAGSARRSRGALPVIIHSNLGNPGNAPASRPGYNLVASLDVEWTKNYRIKNGNVPFCWSVTWLQISKDHDSSLPLGFSFTSAYVSDSDETQSLIKAADAEIGLILNQADLIIGHQVSSDLAVLCNASQDPLPEVQRLRDRWHRRREAASGPVVIDSRYDTDNILTGASRRLVDVCMELNLDVTQPELARTSMTALHRVWLTRADPSARERITVLNLRHGLSTAYVALRSAGFARWNGQVNVNHVLDRQLEGRFAWLKSPVFRRLV
jgi:hypothetical protein